MHGDLLLIPNQLSKRSTMSQTHPEQQRSYSTLRDGVLLPQLLPPAQPGHPGEGSILLAQHRPRWLQRPQGVRSEDLKMFWALCWGVCVLCLLPARSSPEPQTRQRVPWPGGPSRGFLAIQDFGGCGRPQWKGSIGDEAEQCRAPGAGSLPEDGLNVQRVPRA